MLQYQNALFTNKRNPGERRYTPVTKQNKKTLLFGAFFLLGGILHSGNLHGFSDAFIYCLEYLIYAGLILSWIQAVGRRLSPSKAKSYLLAAAYLMLLFLAAQMKKRANKRIARIIPFKPPRKRRN